MTPRDDRPTLSPSPRRPWHRRRRFSFGLDLRREIDREIAAHLEHAAEELAASGRDPEAAREEARRRFGDLDRYRDACCAIDRRRESVRLRARLWGDLRQDLRLAWRTLRRDPAFLLAAVLTLALGLGANVAVFSVVYGVLLKPLPFPHPERLVMLWEKNPDKGWTAAEVAPANFLDWRRPNPAFADITGYQNGIDLLAWTGGGEPRALRAARVTGNFCNVLGVVPARGRALRWDETWRGHHRVALVSDAFWRHHLGGDPGVIGSTLRLDEVAVTVAGVMPPGFAFPEAGLDLWLPVGWSPDNVQQVWFRRAHMLRAVGRLRPGVSLGQARGYLAATAGQLEHLYPETNRHMGAGSTPLAEWWVGERRPTLLLLAGAVGLVLLIACVNVANLQLVRATARLREMGLRQALGAGRWRLVRQLLSESLLLAVVAGAAGVAAGAWAMRGLVALAPDSLPRVTEIGLHPAVLAFALGTTLATALLFGLAPALAVSRPRPTALQDARATVPRTALRSREALVVAEVALATLLVAGAGLLLRSFDRMRHADPGFRADHVLAVELSLPEKRYSEDVQAIAFYDRLIARAAALPGVTFAALADGLPPTGRGWTGDFAIAGRPPGEYGAEFHHRLVSPGYFEVLRVPLRRGRFFRAADDAHAPRVALINERLARQYFGAADPIGQRLVLDRKPTPESIWRTVVGVVADERLSGIATAAPAQIFEPFAQSPAQGCYLILRTAGDPLALARPVRALVRALDRDLPLYSVHSLDEIVADTLSAERFLTLLMIAFAATALVLAAVGIASVMSYNIAYRTHELGIRMALGAAAGEILRQSVARALLRAAVGVTCGAAAALALSPLLASLLYSTSATDPATLGAVALFLLAVAGLAAYLPARRTLHIDPAVCLRHE